MISRAESDRVRERRSFLASSAGLLAGAGSLLSASERQARAVFADEAPLVAKVEGEVIFSGRRPGDGVSWFHPRPCMVPAAGGVEALMTLQSISGSDVFGPVHWTRSTDAGKTWTKPRPIPGLARTSLGDGWEQGVCDVVPEYHPASGSVLAIGHNVYYKGGVLARPQRSRWPVSTVWTAAGGWSEPRKLEWNDPRATDIYTCGCSQRVMKEDGDVLIPLTFGPKGRIPRSVTSVLCAFDGKSLQIRKVGNELGNTAGRGLLEPSLGRFAGRYYMTIRAEDGRGYVAESEDGLRWEPQRPWCWDDDGEPLAMSTTQQHWLIHSDQLFLVYNRKAEENADVIRWRAPLYLARVDLKTLRLVRSTERVVLPLIADGGNPKRVALMGNFHTVAASPQESWVTVGENSPWNGYHGDTLLARVHWSRPNRLALTATDGPG